MCGITGIIYKDQNRRVDPSILQKANDTLTHRGPDDAGIFTERNVGIAIRRLSIIDVAGGRQPISNENDSIHIVYNGELYNYMELRKTLIQKGHSFKTKSDTEVVLKAYIQWGTEFIYKLNGMFGIAIWDSENNRLLLARDRIGIKPLFYFEDDVKFIFGSEIKTLLCHPEVMRETDIKSLYYHFLLNYVPENLTLFKNISNIPPGHFLIVDENGSKIKKYWEIKPHSEQSKKSFYDYCENFLFLLKDSVKIRLQSDVPLGVFLSGGLDSSSITTAASMVSNSKIQTFSVGFEEESFDETPYSNLIAQHLHTDHHHILIKPDIIDILPHIINHMEEPTADSSAVPVFYLSQYTKQFVTVALSGDGADELAAGYETYTADYLAQYCKRIPGFRELLKYFNNILPVSHNKYSMKMKIERFLKGINEPPAISHFLWRAIWYFDELSSLFNLKHYNHHIIKEIKNRYLNLFNFQDSASLLSKSLYADTAFYLPNDMLIKVDRMSMANSLEVRVPFLDHRIVEFFFNLPDKYKLHNLFGKKYLIKKSMQSYLPKKIINRSKAGFNVPISTWFNTSLKTFTNDLLNSQDVKNIPFININYIKKIWHDHQNNKSDHGYKLWSILIFILWYKIHIMGKTNVI